MVSTLAAMVFRNHLVNILVIKGLKYRVGSANNS